MDYLAETANLSTDREYKANEDRNDLFRVLGTQGWCAASQCTLYEMKPKTFPYLFNETVLNFFKLVPQWWNQHLRAGRKPTAEIQLEMNTLYALSNQYFQTNKAVSCSLWASKNSTLKQYKGLIT